MNQLAVQDPKHSLDHNHGYLKYKVSFFITKYKVSLDMLLILSTIKYINPFAIQFTIYAVNSSQTFRERDRECVCVCKSEII